MSVDQNGVRYLQQKEEEGREEYQQNIVSGIEIIPWLNYALLHHKARHSAVNTAA